MEEPREVGTGPHPRPWPDDPRFDPALLVEGDRRNVVDHYRWWSVEAIAADLDTRRHPLHVAVESWQRDLNTGSVVRTANAFNVEGVHIVGRRSWNRRGAMRTDAYLHVHHHPDVAALGSWAEAHELPLLGVDNVPGAVPIGEAAIPRRCVLLFGEEGPGLTAEALAAAQTVVAVPQWGSTRSLNAAAAAAIAMWEWVRRHAGPPPGSSAP